MTNESKWNLTIGVRDNKSYTSTKCLRIFIHPNAPASAGFTVPATSLRSSFRQCTTISTARVYTFEETKRMSQWDDREHTRARARACALHVHCFIRMYVFFVLYLHFFPRSFYRPCVCVPWFSLGFRFFYVCFFSCSFFFCVCVCAFICCAVSRSRSGSRSVR